MFTLLWTFYNRGLLYKTETSLANHNLSVQLDTNRTSPSNFASGFVPSPVSSNLQMGDYQDPSASRSTEGGWSSFAREANSCSNGQLGETSAASDGASRDPSGAKAVQQFQPESGELSLQQRPQQPQQQTQQQKASSSSSQSNSDRYKTELCRPFEESGICRYGHKCQFAHGSSELRTLSRHPKYKTEPCRTFHSVGLCPYGTRCHFIHNQPEQQPVPSENTSGEPSSFNSSNEPHLGFNPEPQPRMQSTSNSGVPLGHNHAPQTPLLLTHQVLSSGRMLPASYPVAPPAQVVPAGPAAPAAPAAPAVPAAPGPIYCPSVNPILYNTGRVPSVTCHNNAVTFGQEMGGFFAPVAMQNHNFANATAYYNSQQLGLAASGQFPMPLATPQPAATILAQAGVGPAAAAAFAPGTVAAALMGSGTAASATAGPAATTAVGNSLANIIRTTAEGPATAAQSPEPNFSLQLPGAQSESPEFDVVTSTLDSLFGTDNFDDFVSRSSSSSSLNNSGTPSRRLPIFSRLSDSDK
uniref:mRNA decay activator protein ZFP36 n=1 Tax=Meriones unguiculatus TaxID=10047 RepID=A0A0S1FMM1_MERUN|nr:zinc finger protein 36 C3H type-like 3 [Meriones unguiculatus]